MKEWIVEKPNGSPDLADMSKFIELLSHGKIELRKRDRTERLGKWDLATWGYPHAPRTRFVDGLTGSRVGDSYICFEVIPIEHRIPWLDYYEVEDNVIRAYKYKHSSFINFRLTRPNMRRREVGEQICVGDMVLCTDSAPVFAQTSVGSYVTEDSLPVLELSLPAESNNGT